VLRSVRPGARVVVGAAGLTYRCPPAVFDLGDVAAPALRAGMAGTLAVFQASHAADRIAAGTGRPAGRPRMAAICFANSGATGSFLYCDFTGPATGTGPAGCVLMPPLPYFRRAKQVIRAGMVHQHGDR
jgi:sulfide:quinone oxidoreductase